MEQINQIQDMVVQVSSYAKVQAYGWTHRRMTPTSFSVMNNKNQKLLISNFLLLILSRALLFKRRSYNLSGSLSVKATVIVEKKKFATTCRLT